MDEEHPSVSVQLRFHTQFSLNQNFVQVDGYNLNRRFTSKHTHPVDVWVKQGCTCCNAQMGDLNQNNNKNYTLAKDSKDSTIKQSLIQQNTSCGLKAVKGVEVLPLVTQ